MAHQDDLRKPILPGKGASDYERYLRTDELLALGVLHVGDGQVALLPDGGVELGQQRRERGRADLGIGVAPTEATPLGMAVFAPALWVVDQVELVAPADWLVGPACANKQRLSLV